jgi:hypothetical protein
MDDNHLNFIIELFSREKRLLFHDDLLHEEMIHHLGQDVYNNVFSAAETRYHQRSQDDDDDESKSMEELADSINRILQLCSSTANPSMVETKIEPVNPLPESISDDPQFSKFFPLLIKSEETIKEDEEKKRLSLLKYSGFSWNRYSEWFLENEHANESEKKKQQDEEDRKKIKLFEQIIACDRLIVDREKRKNENDELSRLQHNRQLSEKLQSTDFDQEEDQEDQEEPEVIVHL